MKTLWILAAAATFAACHNRSEETGAAPDRGDTTSVTPKTGYDTTKTDTTKTGYDTTTAQPTTPPSAGYDTTSTQPTTPPSAGYDTTSAGVGADTSMMHGDSAMTKDSTQR